MDGHGVLPDTVSPMERIAITTGFVCAMVGLVTMPITFALLNALLRPLGALGKGVERISRGDFDTPVPQMTSDELGGAVSGFNRLQKRVRRPGRRTACVADAHRDRVRRRTAPRRAQPA